MPSHVFIFLGFMNTPSKYKLYLIFMPSAPKKVPNTLGARRHGSIGEQVNERSQQRSNKRSGPQACRSYTPRLLTLILRLLGQAA